MHSNRNWTTVYVKTCKKAGTSFNFARLADEGAAPAVFPYMHCFFGGLCIHLETVMSLTLFHFQSKACRLLKAWVIPFLVKKSEEVLKVGNHAAF